jgi:hypothetical protein
MNLVFTDNPRLIAFADSLSIPIPQAVGMILYLMQYAAKYAPDGALGGILADTSLALLLSWPKDDTPRLMHALTTSTLPGQTETWCSYQSPHGLIINDWYKIAPLSVHERLLRDGRRFATGQIPKAYHLRTHQRVKLLAQYDDLLPAEKPTKHLAPKPTKTPKKKRNTTDLTSAFDRLWEIYPKKAGKKPALEKYLALNPDPETQTAIFVAVQQYAETVINTDPQWIIMLKSYLHQRRWLDELPPKPSGSIQPPDIEPREPSEDDIVRAEGLFDE